MRDKMPAIAHYFAHFRSLQSRRDRYGIKAETPQKAEVPQKVRRREEKSRLLISSSLYGTSAHRRPLRIGDLCASATSAHRRPLRIGDLCASAIDCIVVFED